MIHSSPPRLSPLSLWDPELTPTFSASVNDAVLEKLLQLLELRSGRFVEIGVSAMRNLHEWWETQGKSLWKMEVVIGFHGRIILPAGMLYDLRTSLSLFQ